MPEEHSPAQAHRATPTGDLEPVNPLLPCGHRKLAGCSGCEPSPHDPATAEALLEAGFSNDADLGLAVRLLVTEIGMTDFYIGWVWEIVFGHRAMPTKAESFSVGPRRTALKRIAAMCSRVEWPWQKDLPEGVEVAVSDRSNRRCPHLVFHNLLGWRGGGVHD